jgi:hypothetical protein
MIKPTVLKPFKSGYGDVKVAFYPRMATIAEQEEIEARLLDISDADELKNQRKFEIYRQAIGEWSAEMPQLIVKERGEVKFVPLVEDAATATEAIESFFSERTAENERVIRAAYNAFVNLFQPETDFL